MKRSKRTEPVQPSNLADFLNCQAILCQPTSNLPCQTSSLNYKRIRKQPFMRNRGDAVFHLTDISRALHANERERVIAEISQ